MNDRNSSATYMYMMKFLFIVFVALSGKEMLKCLLLLRVCFPAKVRVIFLYTVKSLNGF